MLTPVQTENNQVIALTPITLYACRFYQMCYSLMLEIQPSDFNQTVSSFSYPSVFSIRGTTTRGGSQPDRDMHCSLTEGRHSLQI
jgi:hypothetical protein